MEDVRGIVVKHAPVEGVWLRFILEGKGKIVDINPMTYGKFRVHVGVKNQPFYDDSW